MLRSAHLCDDYLAGRKCVFEENEEVRDALSLEEQYKEQAAEKANHLPKRDKDMSEVSSVPEPLHELAQVPDVFCNNIIWW
jgi:hypothetical protein